ncbi:hypothetical protein CBR_g44540 [Chara braunii]|uniref:Uncharacterized protein n=1 Tax=Chara braunii TaxID=69332 RepID=A0A388LXV2_CHABU|nr:hypothetical protein CBR_g44540 [Chara braunii]|eukprot:GBG87083.1 hypothetical protein CBR_g44540 [Chara braunii]
MQIFVREPWSGRSMLLPVDERLTVRLLKRKAMAMAAALAGTAGAPPGTPFPTPQSGAECLLLEDDVSLFYGGKRLQEELLLLRGGLLLLGNLSTVELRLPLRGGGGDGGATGAESRDCYLKMYAEKKPDKVDPKDARLAKWSRCCLTSEGLQPPCAIDYLGNLFNKENVVRGLVEKSLPSALGHVQSLKDIITLQLTENHSNVGGREMVENRSFCCPISGVDFNGMFKFVALAACGHALSSRALKELKATACPVCSKPFEETDQIVINGSEEEVRVLRDRLQERKERMKMAKKENKKKRREGREEREEATTLGDKDRGGDAQSRKMEDKARTDHNDRTLLRLRKNYDGAPAASAAATASAASAASAAAAAVSGGGLAKGKVGSRGERERGKGVEIAPAAKRFKAVDNLPQHATKEVYASIFNSSVRPDAVAETYSCRSLPIGRN